ncbi:hypothetical protein B0A69_08425 [Chryseobacterium shigense]|uniref:C1q domain-containing protein n=1 Tax=Chryseobacterium shigense TaxID=297244 RepID=A0A1N7IFW5_9FLAO|nr:hypothetical protein [Chryseobacterium shigense]PQA94481.1 hypothetical protein B0A69_08425 [Chryseobacterium shigense]SIS35841.1 hypothetical protein SAMN05421639_103472 [Chryseobacterium shigense]
MKKKLTIALIMGGGLLIKSQVGINMAKPEAILHVDGQKNTIPAVSSSYDDDVAITSSGNMGAGTKLPKTRLDIRSDEHLNALGIGGTSQTASAAKAGALRYNSGTQDLSYSNGTVWTALAHKAPNDFVDAENSSAQSFTSGTQAVVTNWTKKTDVNGNFNATTGTFVASKTGVYIVAFTFSLASGTIANDSRYETLIQTNSTSSATNKVFKCVGSYPGTNGLSSRVAGNCSGIFNLIQGDQITVNLNQALGTAKTLDTDASMTSLSIFGL